MRAQLTKFMAYMTSLEIAAHAIVLFLVLGAVALAYFLIRDKSAKQTIYLVAFLVYSPFLIFYMAKPKLLTFMESKLKNNFDDVTFSEKVDDKGAGRKVIE